MTAAALDMPPLHAPRRPQLDLRQQSILATICLCAGIAPLAARWIPDQGARIVYGALIAAAFLALTLFARKQPALHQFWELSFAFFVLALGAVLNNSLPGFVGTVILNDLPKAGNPLASTVSGTVLIQVLDTLIAIVPVVVLTRVSRRDLGSIYARTGVIGGWLAFAVMFFVLLYVFLATLPLRPDSPMQQLLPTHGTLTVDRFLGLTPALFVVALTNGFGEEFVFRGLFLQKYNWFFDARVSNLLQAIVFTTAHVGITYSPSALLFIVVAVFPLGLVAGYLMRATNGVLVPGILHGGLDMAIYLGFLSAAS